MLLGDWFLLFPLILLIKDIPGSASHQCHCDVKGRKQNSMYCSSFTLLDKVVRHMEISHECIIYVVRKANIIKISNIYIRNIPYVGDRVKY